MWGQRGGGLVGAPFGFSESALPGLMSALVAVPAYAVSPLFGETATYNLAVLSGLVLSGLAAYALVRRLGGSVIVSAWAGAAFAFFPWHLGRALGAPSQTHLEALPLLVLALVVWRERPGIARAGLVGAALLLCLVTDPYIGLMGCVIVAVLGPALAVERMRRAGGTRGVVDAGVLTGAAALALTPILLARWATEGPAATGVQRSSVDLSVYGARLAEYARPPAANPILGPLVGPDTAERLHGSNASETTLYLGWSVILLALAFLALAWSRWGVRGDRGIAAAGVSIALIALWFAAPPPIVVLGVEIPSPMEKIVELAPYWRVSSRFVAVVMLVAVVFAALGLERLRRAVGDPRARAAIAIGAVGLLAVDLAAWPPLPWFRDAAPQGYTRLLASQPGGTVVAEYPLRGRGDPHTSIFLSRQRLHGQPLLNGGVAGSLPDRIRNALVDPGGPGVASALAAARVQMIVVHEDEGVGPGTPQPPPDSPGLEQVALYPGGVGVYRVTAAPAPAIIDFRSGWSDGLRDARGGYRYVTFNVADLRLIPRRPGPATIVMTLSSVGGARHVRVLDEDATELWAGTVGRRDQRLRFTRTLTRRPQRMVIEVSEAPTLRLDGTYASLRVGETWIR